MPQLSDSILGTFFGVLQAVIIMGLGGAVKLWVDVRILRKDMNEAFKKIRKLENEK
jgi:hypothetical protein